MQGDSVQHEQSVSTVSDPVKSRQAIPPFHSHHPLPNVRSLLYAWHVFAGIGAGWLYVVLYKGIPNEEKPPSLLMSFFSRA